MGRRIRFLDAVLVPAGASSAVSVAAVSAGPVLAPDAAAPPVVAPTPRSAGAAWVPAVSCSVFPAFLLDAFTFLGTNWNRQDVLAASAGSAPSMWAFCKHSHCEDRGKIIFAKLHQGLLPRLR